MAGYDPTAFIYDDIDAQRQRNIDERARAVNEARVNRQQEYADQMRPTPEMEEFFRVYGGPPTLSDQPAGAGDIALPPLGAPGPVAPVLPPPSAGTSLRSHAAELKDSGRGLTRGEFNQNRQTLGLEPVADPVAGALANVPAAPVAAPPAVESMDALKKRFGFSWGSGVDLDPQTGRPTTSTVVRDPVTRQPVQAREAEGPPDVISSRTGAPMGPAVSYPGGTTDDDYLRYRSRDPLELAGLRLGQQNAHTALERAQIGPAAAPETTGERLQGEQEMRRAMGTVPLLAQELDEKLAAIDAKRIELELWRSGKDPRHSNQPLSEANYQKWSAQLDEDKLAATAENRLKVAATHKGSASGLAPRP